MKINSVAKINGAAVDIVSLAARLEWRTPGRAIMRTTAEVEKGQLVEIAVQAGADAPQMFLLGFVEAVAPEGGASQILVRELAAVLNIKMHIAKRHARAADVLKDISEKTGLKFVMPEGAEWASTELARFQHTGNGYSALDKLLVALEVKNGCWHQQPNGVIFFGEREQSQSGSKSLKINPKIFDSITVAGGQLPAIPNLRPGLKIVVAGEEKYINTVELSENKMRINWCANLEDKRMKATE